MRATVYFFHLGVNGLADFYKMSFFAAKITDDIAGFAATCVWYFLPTKPTDFDCFHCLFPFLLVDGGYVVNCQIWYLFQWYKCQSGEYCFSAPMIDLLRPAWQGPYPFG